MPDQTLETAGATCADCGQNMLRASGCTKDYIYVPGTTDRVGRIRYGSESLWKDVPDRCHDCGAAVGNFHHARCDMEECPACGDQLIGHRH